MTWPCPRCGNPTLHGIETQDFEWCECSSCGYQEPAVRRSD